MKSQYFFNSFKQRLCIFSKKLSNENKQRLYKIQKSPTSLFYHVLLIKQNECTPFWSFHFGLILFWSHATHSKQMSFVLAKYKLHYFQHHEKLNFYEWKNPTTQYVAHCMYGAHSCLLELLQLWLPFGLCMALVNECTRLSWALRNSRSVQLSAQK